MSTKNLLSCIMGSNVETKKLSIDEMTVEQLREALEKKMLLEKENTKEKNEEKNEKNEIDAKCIYCQDEPELPVYWNGVDPKWSREYASPRIRPCPASKSQPHCLRCGRQHMNMLKEQGKHGFRCWSGCCRIEMYGYRTYGPFERGPNDHAWKEMYQMMDSYNIGVTKCRLCNKDCKSVMNLSSHVKKDCPKRFVKCDICKVSVRFDNLQNHKMKCYKFCKFCGPGLKTEYKIGVDGKTTDHRCPHKPIAKCNFCHEPITLLNFHSKHSKCMFIKKRELSNASSVSSSDKKNWNCIPVTIQVKTEFIPVYNYNIPDTIDPTEPTDEETF